MLAETDLDKKLDMIRRLRHNMAVEGDGDTEDLIELYGTASSSITGAAHIQSIAQIVQALHLIYHVPLVPRGKL